MLAIPSLRTIPKEASGASAVLVQSGNTLSLSTDLFPATPRTPTPMAHHALRHDQRSEYHDPGSFSWLMHHPMRRIGIITLSLALRQLIAPKISASAWISTARRAPSTSSRISAPTNIPVWRLRTSSIDYPSSSANCIPVPLARQFGSVGIAVDLSDLGLKAAQPSSHPQIRNSSRYIPMSRQFSRPWRI